MGSERRWWKRRAAGTVSDSAIGGFLLYGGLCITLGIVTLGLLHRAGAGNGLVLLGLVLVRVGWQHTRP